MNRKQVILGIFVLLFGLSFTSARAEDNCLKGKEALAKGDLENAIKFLKDGIENDKKNAECMFNLGLAYLQMPESAAVAETYLIQARELDSNNAKIYLALGDAYKKEGVGSAATEQYLTAVRHDSTNPEIYKKIGYSYLGDRKYNEAVSYLIKAAALDTTDLKVYKDIGHIYFRSGASNSALYDKALPYLKFVYDHNPKDSIRSEYAQALFERGRYKEFIPVAEQIVTEDPSRKDLRPNIGNSFVKLGMPDSAAKWMGDVSAVNMKPADELDYGLTLDKIGQTDSAIAHIENAARRDTTLATKAYYPLGQMYMKVKNFDKAIEMFEKKITTDTTSSMLFASHLNTAICEMQGKEFGKAKDHILKSLDYRPDYIPAWRYLAECYSQLDATDDARKSYKKMLTLIDTSSDQAKYKDAAAEGHRLEGFYLLLEKKYVTASKELEEAIKIDPTCQTLLWAAQSKALQNLRDDAKRYYCKVLNNKCDPKLVADAKKGLTAMGITPEDCGK